MDSLSPLLPLSIFYIAARNNLVHHIMLLFGVKTSNGILLCLELNPKCFPQHTQLWIKGISTAFLIQHLLNFSLYFLYTCLQLITCNKSFLTLRSLHCISFLFSPTIGFALFFQLQLQEALCDYPSALSFYCTFFPLSDITLALQNTS